MSLPVLYPSRVKHLVDLVANQVEEKPDVIVGMSTGGFIVAAMLAKRLGVLGQNLIGLPVDPDYNLETSLVGLKDGGRWQGKKVLVVDDMTNRGYLLDNMLKLFQRAGADVKTCVLVANKKGIIPTIVGAYCEGKPPEGFWEVWS